MSYILDALKKAEAENDPDVRTSLAMQDHHSRKQQIIQYLMIVALIGNALLLFWLFAPLNWNLVTTDNTLVSEPATAAASASTSPPDSQTSSTPAQAAGTPAQAADVPARPAPAVATAPPRPQASAAQTARPVRTTLSGLPAAARNRFPGLSFSTHVYATDPATRAVVVNGQRLAEGDRLGSLQLAEITEDGVVFRFENYLVAVSVLEQWD